MTDIFSLANCASCLDRARVVGGLPDVVAIQEGKVNNNVHYITVFDLKQHFSICVEIIFFIDFFIWFEQKIMKT